MVHIVDPRRMNGNLILSFPAEMLTAKASAAPESQMGTFLCEKLAIDLLVF